MPREKNRLLRTVVPAAVLLAGLGVAASLFLNSGHKSSPAPVSAGAETAIQGAEQQKGKPGSAQDESLADAQLSPTAESPPDAQSASQPQLVAGEAPDELADAGGQPDQDAADSATAGITAAGSLRARVFTGDAGSPEAIGSVDPDGDDLLELRFTRFGAGIESISLTKHYQSVRHSEHYVLQARAEVALQSGAVFSVASLAAREVEINGQPISLYAAPGSDASASLWRELAPGEFEAIIENAQGGAVARISKQYEVKPGSYEIVVRQALENLTQSPMTIRWVQYGPVDLQRGAMAYGGDKRRIRFGALFSPSIDPTRQEIDSVGKLRARMSLMRRIDKVGGPMLLWPSDKIANDRELAWVAMTNRYFAFAVHRGFTQKEIDEASAGRPVNKPFDEAEEVYAIAIGDRAPRGQLDPRVLALQINGPAQVVQAGATLDLSLGAYAGPLKQDALVSVAPARMVGLDSLIIYNFGGPCAFCTFQPLAHTLLWFLGAAHQYIVFDWALAIMLLVLCVRGALHPVTRKSQIGMQRFAKQMQGLQPKMEKLKQRYKNDQKRLQTETHRLMREEGVSFTGMLGCLPMFLQSPVWIALYAMLYFAFDLRQEPGFFGVFQSISGGKWSFLADLSAPDSFIDFGHTIVTLPLLGAIQSINVLPLVLGLVFFLQQKYLMPPTSAVTSPEQQTQQKIMRVMTVVMFPVIMYNAPSGLAIYFATNSTLGILESRHIRAHIAQKDLEPTKRKPAPAERKRVPNAARANPFGKKRPREGSAYKPRKKR